ncbi:MAG: phytanoyl-CoA dioxygenase family protein [Actinomycetota bacterium]
MTPGLHDDLDRDGFVVIPRVLDEHTLGRLRQAFAGDGDTAGTQHVDIDSTTPEVEAWEALGTHLVVLELAAGLMTQPTFAAHGRNPQPGFGQQGLHADSRPRAPGDPVLAVTAIWMIDAFTEHNGATRVVPGTHVQRGAVPRRLAQPDAHHPDEVIIVGPAGSVVVLNGHVWHSGTRNTSTGPRRAAQMTAHTERTNA